MIQQFREGPFTAVNIIISYYWAPAYALKHETGTNHGVCWNSISMLGSLSLKEKTQGINLVSALPAHIVQEQNVSWTASAPSLPR